MSGRVTSSPAVGRDRNVRALAYLIALIVIGTAPALAADPLAEARKSFTIGGKPIPPEIFSDFGDAMMSDNRPIVVTIDALAAIDYNCYFDPITKKGRLGRTDKDRRRRN